MITSQAGIASAKLIRATQVYKISFSNTSGYTGSYWNVNYNPGAIPTTPATCNSSTAGAIVNFPATSGNVETYFNKFKVVTSVGSSGGLEIHDRLAHMGGLVGNVTTQQTVGLDLSTLLSTDNISNRIISSDYSKVQWWFEIYTSLGSTASTATINYTNQNGVSNTTTMSIAAGIGSVGRILQIIPTVPGDFIRSVDNITLSTSIGSAGNFGITATVQLTETPNVGGSYNNAIYEWPVLGLQKIQNNACLFFLCDCMGNAIAIFGELTLMQG